MAPADQDIQQKYDRAARTYDQLWQHYINATLDYVTDTLQLRGDEHVLTSPAALERSSAGCAPTTPIS